VVKLYGPQSELLKVPKNPILLFHVTTKDKLPLLTLQVGVVAQFTLAA